MAEEVDLKFLGEQIKRLQGDVRVLKSDMAQMRADSAKVESDIALLNTKMTWLKKSLEAFRDNVNDRLDQQVELIKSSFRALTLEIQTLKKS